jgi:hypothetical protein
MDENIIVTTFSEQVQAKLRELRERRERLRHRAHR